MNQRQVEAFRAVMKHGSITRAAEIMHISQPAVSRLIAGLEADIGFRLFVRSGGKTQPTAEAESLIEEVDFFFNGLEKVYSAAREIRSLQRGHLRLAGMPTVSFRLLPELVSAFSRDNPSVKVTMDVHTSPTIVKLLAARQFELGIAQMPEARPDIEVLATYRMECVCAMPPDHRLAVRDRIYAKDLRCEPMIALSHHTLAAQHVAQNFLAADIRPDIRIESQPSYAACALVAERAGIAIVDPLTARFFGKDRVIAVPFAPAVPFDVRLMRPSGAQVSNASAEFATAASEFLNAVPEMTRL